MRRGAVLVECSRLGCYASGVYPAEQLSGLSVDAVMLREGWRVTGGTDVCPRCLEEEQEKADALEA